MDGMGKDSLHPLQAHAAFDAYYPNRGQAGQSPQKFYQDRASSFRLVDCEGGGDAHDDDQPFGEGNERFWRTNIGACQKIAAYEFDTDRTHLLHDLRRIIHGKGDGCPEYMQEKQNVRGKYTPEAARNQTHYQGDHHQQQEKP